MGSRSSGRSPGRGRLTLLAIGLAIVLFLAINMLAGALLKASRLDLTEDRLFTLADGTKEVLRSIDEPIDLRFYYNRRLDELGPYFASYANRVDELLAEYQRLSNGRVRVERLDPQPFSPEEDLAVAEGLQGCRCTTTAPKPISACPGATAPTTTRCWPISRPSAATSSNTT